MKTSELESMSVAELWELHEQVAAELSGKILAEKKTLEERLRRFEGGGLRLNGEAQKTRRSYPKVYPKYRNPRNRSETWAGRGKQAPLAGCAASIRQKARGLPDKAAIARGNQPESRRPLTMV